MKNKKGFTIIEVLITIVIIGVLALIATPLVVNYLNEGKEKYNESIKNELRQMAESYFSDNPKELPRGQTTTDNNGNINGMKIISKVTLNELEKNNYVLNDLVDADDNECSESYVVVELANGKYQYHSCLKCGNNDYTTDDSYCEFTLSDGSLNDFGTRSCEIVYDVPESNWINYDLNLTMKATSDFDVIRFVDDNNKVITPEKVGNLYTGNYMISKTGSYNIYAIDKTGTKFRCNESAIAINIDKEKPTCGTTTGAGSIQNWVNTDRTITQYCNDAGGSNCEQSSFVKTFKDTATTDAITIKDLAGNTNSCIVGVYIDKDAPSCKFTGPSSTEIKITDTSTYKLTCTDKSGITTTASTLKSKLTSTSGIEITNVTRSGSATNYTYTITVKGTAKGEQSITLPKSSILDNASNSNAAITSSKINVTGKYVTEIVVTSSTPIWIVSDDAKTETATATVSPSDATLKTVKWSSSNTNVATVNSSTGVITPVSYGAVDICATATDGSGIKGCKTINVNKVVLNNSAIKSNCNAVTSTGTCYFKMNVGKPTVVNGNNTVTTTITNGEFVSTGTVYNWCGTSCCDHSRWVCLTNIGSSSSSDEAASTAYGKDCVSNSVLIKTGDTSKQCTWTSGTDPDKVEPYNKFLQDAELTVTPTSGVNKYYIQVMGLDTSYSVCNALSDISNPTSYSNCPANDSSTSTTRSSTIAITIYAP